MTANIPGLNPAQRPSSVAARHLLIETGHLLHGIRWTSALARDLGIGEKSVRDWNSGKNHTFTMDHDLWGEILLLVTNGYTEAISEAHRTRLATLQHEIIKNLPPAASPQHRT